MSARKIIQGLEQAIQYAQGRPNGARERTIMIKQKSVKRPASIDTLANDMRKFVFTAAKDWTRAIRVNREERDYIVSILDAARSKEPSP